MGFIANKTRQKNPKNRKNKIHLVFDETKRKEFLTGFHKRKVQRKKEAKEKFEKQLKEERKRLKNEAKESYKKLVVSHRNIPELENLLAEEYEDDEVNVKITELSTNEIARQNNWIGPNQPKYESSDESDSNKEEEEEIPGMELKSSDKRAQSKKYSSEKEIKKILKVQNVKNAKKSKVFQMKNKMEQIKQRKKSMVKKKEKLKVQMKKGKNGRKHKK